MDESKRMITKIAREAGRFCNRALEGADLTPGEQDLLQAVRKQSDCTQEQLADKLGRDKGAVTRSVQNLERKGYLLRRTNPDNRRQKLLTVTERALEVKHSTTQCQAFFYAWLLEDLPPEERAAFLETLDKLYWKSKLQRREEFARLLQRWEVSHDDLED